MSDYWYTDEYGRKRHVGGDSSERYSIATKHDYHAINSLFSNYSRYFSRSRLHSTHCPVCSADVFFCECDNGGRVFFDTLAPTWKKHPCTTSYESGNRVKTYRLIHPKENHFIKKGQEKTLKKTIMEVPDFMDRFELNLNNPRVYANLVDNCTVLVRQHNGKLLLTIIVNNQKFTNEYLCHDKEFARQRELEEFLEHLLWNTNLSESLKLKKVQNKIKTIGEHKVIQVNKQNVGKVISTMAEQQKKLHKKKSIEEKQQESAHNDRQERRKRNKKASQNEQSPNPTIPKREDFSIVKKKTPADNPITPVSTPKLGSKMSLDQFGSVSEALKAIKQKLLKQLDEKND